MRRICFALLCLLFGNLTFAMSLNWVARPIIGIDWPPQKEEITLKQLRTDTFAEFNQAVLPQWQYKMFRAGGFLNFDIIPKTMQKTMPGEEEDYFVLSNAGINLEADPINWLTGHIGIAYYKSNKGQGDFRNNTGLLFDDGYILVRDFNKLPLYFQAGRFYLPFGIYDRYTISPTLAQMLSESRADGVQAGLVEFYGMTLSAYVVQGSVTHTSGKFQGDINSGVSVLFRHAFDNGLQVGGGFQYIYNMLNNNSLRQGGIFSTGLTGRVNVYQRRTDGIATQAHIAYGPLTVYANYVTALQKTNDLPLKYATLEPLSGPTLGARPSSWDVGTVFRFILFGHDAQVDFSYQRSYDTNGLVVFNALPNHPFPKTRYFVGGTYFVLKNAYVRIQWGHNVLYGLSDGDVGRQGDNATIRLGFRV